MFDKYFKSEKGRAIFSEIKTTTFAYIKAQFVLFFAAVAVITAGLIILGMKWWALPIAIGVAVVDLLPVLGSGAVFIPWTIYCFYISDYRMAVGLIILFVAVTLLKLLLEPLVCGKKIGLSALETLGACVAGFAVFGGSGILLGPLLAVILKIVMKHI